MKTREQLFSFIRKQKVSFIASVDEEGYPNMKAMFMPGKIEDDSFYYSTNTSSLRATQFLDNPKASIYFYNKGHFKYEAVMLTGTMEVLQDPQIKEELWHPQDVIYYKQGVTEPPYWLLKFTAVRGRHYCALKTENFRMEDLT